MAVLYLDSFDDRLGATLGGERYDASAINASSGVQAGGRTANYLYLAQNQYVQKLVAPAPSTTIIVGFAFNPSLLPSVTSTLAMIQDGAGLTHCLLRLNADGTVSVVNNAGTVLGTSAVTLTTAAWQYLEWKLLVDGAAGTSSVKLNGAVITAGAGLNTQGGATTVIGHVQLTWTNATGTGGFDDFYLADASSGVNNDFLGLLKIECLHPSGAGAHADFTPVGAGTNYGCVADASYDDDATYVAANGVGAKDSYAHQALASTAVVITACQVVLRARKDDVLARSIAPLIRSAGADYPAATIALSGVSYADYTQVITNDPATAAAWLPTAVNGCEIGVTIIS